MGVAVVTFSTLEMFPPATRFWIAGPFVGSCGTGLGKTDSVMLIAAETEPEFDQFEAEGRGWHQEVKDRTDQER